MKRFWLKHKWLRRTTYSFDVQRWHQLEPQASIVVLDHAGHLVYDDQPEKVNQLLLSFLAA